MQHKNDVKAVLVDLDMPVMDGEATIKALRRIDPHIKAIAMSGPTESQKSKTALCAVDACITKPFTVDKLLKVISETI